MKGTFYDEGANSSIIYNKLKDLIYCRHNIIVLARKYNRQTENVVSIKLFRVLLIFKFPETFLMMKVPNYDDEGSKYFRIQQHYLI